MKSSMVLGGALVLAFTLGACTPHFAESLQKPASKAVHATPSKPAIPGDLDGNGTLSGWEKEQLAKATYTLPDGTSVAIPTGQPLPAPVTQDIQSKINPLSAPLGNTQGTTEAAASLAFHNAVKAAGVKINRTIISIFYSTVADSGARGWVVGPPAPLKRGGFRSAADAVAYANAFADGESQYAVIVFG